MTAPFMMWRIDPEALAQDAAEFAALPADAPLRQWYAVFGPPAPVQEDPR